MKKKCLFIIFNLLILTFANAYELKVIKEYPFDNFFEYYESWRDEIGYSRPGISILLNNSKMTVLNNYSNNMFFVVENFESQKKADMSSIHGSLNDYIYINYGHDFYIYKNSTDLNNPDYILTSRKDDHFRGELYETENYVFAQVGSGSLVSWELKGEGKSEYRDAGKTWELLRKDGMMTKLGITMDDDGSEIYFGEFLISLPRYPNVKNIWQKQTFKTPGYENYKNVEDFTYLGTTKNGTAILFKSKPAKNGRSAYRDSENPIELVIAVLDPWTRGVNVIELDPGCWNPPRTKSGLIPAVSQCIDEEGNVYFTDCNKEKGCYEIKKLSNEWLNQYEFANRPIARMKANHIALQEYPGEPKEEEAIYGYNFDHEYLWILSKTGNWLKVRKVDGREGWVNMQYVTVNEGTDLTQLELTKKELKAMEKARKAKK